MLNSCETFFKLSPFAQWTFKVSLIRLDLKWPSEPSFYGSFNVVSKKARNGKKNCHISVAKDFQDIFRTKNGQFAFYSFIYLRFVPAFNEAGQVTRNIIKPTFMSFPVKSWGSETTPLATHTFNRSYKISHPPKLKASSDVFIALQPCQKLCIF